jgi:Glutathione S-transferase, N-terminal domain
VQKAKTALYEKGIPFEPKMIDGSEPVASEFAALSPTQRFPVIVDDGQFVFDAGEKIVGTGRVDIEAHDPARKCHVYPVGEPRITQFLPVIAVILAALDADCPQPA